MTMPNALGTSPVGPAGGSLAGNFPNPTFGNAVSWQPSDNALLVACSPPGGISAGALFVAGTVYLRKIFIRQAITATNINFFVSVAGVGASTGSFAGLYSSAGTLLSGSADNGAALTGTGLVTTALSAAQSLAAGTFVWAVLLVNLATTQPTIRADCNNTQSVANIGLAAATLACAVNGTTQTTLPASITPASNAAAGSFPFWVGIT